VDVIAASSQPGRTGSDPLRHLLANPESEGMLSDMESDRDSPTPDDAAAALLAAERSRDRLAQDVELPAGYAAGMTAAVAVQIAATAVGVASDDGARATVLVLGGVVVFGLVAVVQAHRFRRRNAVSAPGFVSRAVLGTAAAASWGEAAALAAAVAAALHDLWWLVGLSAVAGGVVYALSSRRWLQDYRADPDGQAPSRSPAVLVALTVLVVVGLVLLVTSR
jgi:hypothetical protein